MKSVQMQFEFNAVALGARDCSRDAFIAARLSEGPTGESQLMEHILERGNMLEALKRVTSNKGAPGVDGMKTTQLRGYIRRHWDKIKAALLEGTHKPLPVRRTEIPKEDGGMRPLGIPTVLDRLIQQAMAQVLAAIWDHTFSEHSYAYRSGRSQQMAIQKAKSYVEAGYTQVVDIDLSKFFDRVHHDRLMQRLATRVRDKRVLKLIRAYLESGVMIGGVTVETEEGTPQGGPLSPLLANIVLDELDKELERRGLRFVRYADDIAIYVRSRPAAARVLQTVSRFITRRLKLVVNEKKSEVSTPWKSKYLGFHMVRHQGQLRIAIHKKSLRRFKDRVREITAPGRGHSLTHVVGELNRFVRGWGTYFAVGLFPSPTAALDHWIRRRLRAYVWRQWKLPRTKVHNLVARGVGHYWAKAVGNTRKGAWRLSKHGTVCQALPDNYFTRSLGLVLLADFCP